MSDFPFQLNPPVEFAWMRSKALKKELRQLIATYSYKDVYQAIHDIVAEDFDALQALQKPKETPVPAPAAVQETPITPLLQEETPITRGECLPPAPRLQGEIPITHEKKGRGRPKKEQALPAPAPPPAPAPAPAPALQANQKEIPIGNRKIQVQKQESSFTPEHDEKKKKTKSKSKKN